LRLAGGGGRLELSVRDDGAGFDVPAAQARAAAGATLGVTSMQERVAQAGGAFGIESAPGAGTTVLVSFPLATQA
jgi:signal transduction histidine kinase